MNQVQSIRYRGENKHLSFEERRTLEKIMQENRQAPKKKRLTKTAIAEMMGIHRSTLYRELKRGEIEQVDSVFKPYTIYSSDVAQDDYEQKATSKGTDLKIGKDHRLAEYIEKRIIEDKYSPDAIVMELEKKPHDFSVTLSTRTIYNYIEKDVFLRITNKDLPRQGRQKKRRYQPVRKRGLDPGAKSISERPNKIETREEIGHWEMDCMESPKGSSGAGLLTLVERKSRQTIARKLSSITQKQVIKVVDSLEKTMGEKEFQRLFKSITVDNGVEFLDWQSLETSSQNEEKQRTIIYYCHPYSAFERGSNEHVNGILRRHIPKGSDISDYSTEAIQEIEDWTNNYPRRILDGLSAREKLQKTFLKQLLEPLKYLKDRTEKSVAV